MAFIEELKQKLADTPLKSNRGRDEIVVLEGQSLAFQAVIRVYEPALPAQRLPAALPPSF